MLKDNLIRKILYHSVYMCQVMAVLFISSATSHAISINGIFKQGGYITGTLTKNEKPPLKFNGYSLNKQQVGTDGTFVFGINRNAKPEGLITYFKNNKKQQISFIIEPQEYKTQSITGIPKRKVNPNPNDMKKIKQDTSKILKARSIFNNKIKLIAPVSWPVSATITGIYGSRRIFNGEERSWHKGLDIAAKRGEKVYAPTAGVVRLALANSFFNGNLIIIDHGYQLMTIYAHLDEMNVKTGDFVTPKTVIGKVGSTGRATGPHLHWGLYWRNMALDPKLLIQKSNN